jgi:hypothetical protein
MFGWVSFKAVTLPYSLLIRMYVFSLYVIHKEGLSLSSGDINRLMMRYVCIFIVLLIDNVFAAREMRSVRKQRGAA